MFLRKPLTVCMKSAAKHATSLELTHKFVDGLDFEFAQSSSHGVLTLNGGWDCVLYCNRPLGGQLNVLASDLGIFHFMAKEFIFQPFSYTKMTHPGFSAPS